MRVEHQEDLMGKVRAMITSARASCRMVRSARLLYFKEEDKCNFAKTASQDFSIFKLSSRGGQ
jgi:hypothetical protein